MSVSITLVLGGAEGHDDCSGLNGGPQKDMSQSWSLVLWMGPDLENGPYFADVIKVRVLRLKHPGLPGVGEGRRGGA